MVRAIGYHENRLEPAKVATGAPHWPAVNTLVHLVVHRQNKQQG